MPGSIAISPNGNRLYVQSPAQTVTVFDTRANATDSFAITASDGNGGTATIPVTVAVSAINAA